VKHGEVHIFRLLLHINKFTYSKIHRTGCKQVQERRNIRLQNKCSKVEFRDFAEALNLALSLQLNHFIVKTANIHGIFKIGICCLKFSYNMYKCYFDGIQDGLLLFGTTKIKIVQMLNIQ
jgi:hypothetical protein